MQLKFLYPHWGSEHLDFNAFLNVVQTKGFDGIEINIPKHSQFNKALNKVRNENPDFICVLQQVLGIQTETSANYLQRVKSRLEELVPFEPDFINSHTGRDYFTFEENCQIIEVIENFSARRNIPVFHEIHRGRFTFHSLTTLKYLEKFPELKLVGDLSHWCVVSESMLQNQNEIIQKVTPHIHHLHARVGFEQAPQVNHPFAPEWETYLNRFIAWWKDILNYHSDKNQYTITPEFGPYPYMPQQPFTKEPLVDQHAINVEMKDYLKTKLS
ncbi:sugar phosphate isomerase/epimerase [Winogradskyella tangerina]|uniref:sugar phosphate isomerase/epimerase n=1 Tax=Winogradskyella tangerina TaxID=2023240 RepID=UPI000DBE8D81|nr:sugar phosphate isomerase/epimerase [Winogradskyella tangerina]